MEKIFYSHTSEEMKGIAKEVLGMLDGVNLILLRGELGAGKTTFAQGVLETLGAEGPFTSPTFVIMKQYETENKKFKNTFHFDCYRVGSADIRQLGWEEILEDKKNLLLVEWPERIWDLVSDKDKYCLIDFEIIGSGERKIKVTINNK